MFKENGQQLWNTEQCHRSEIYIESFKPLSESWFSIKAFEFFGTPLKLDLRLYVLHLDMHLLQEFWTRYTGYKRKNLLFNKLFYIFLIENVLKSLFFSLGSLRDLTTSLLTPALVRSRMRSGDWPAAIISSRSAHTRIKYIFWNFLKICPPYRYLKIQIISKSFRKILKVYYCRKKVFC